uniref:Molybdenum cofactor sulfurase n=1 Tax=Stygiella incarcerata TaxID=1712417 RepID=A0A192ZIE3_9EUKA|nr:molybdenum cofactor sulfurase [Stygiella incarcerata]|eukprot:TRINITY_DN242_c2_g1_i1.p1 TRINITY_DN242_c2_g1~~TRINITY_DN242_c2_g1_i1.p1  ORF type:complete len:549 (-),score=143.87 TRINITY_DN242_c2_g1_i1:350-1996(-)
MWFKRFPSKKKRRDFLSMAASLWVRHRLLIAFLVFMGLGFFAIGAWIHMSTKGNGSKDEDAIGHAKKEFLSSSANERAYGYDGIIDEMVERELIPRLKDEVYLDYTGSGLYTLSQLDAYFEDLRQHVYGNTHSRSPSSSRTEDRVDEARKLILEFFNADPSEYTVIFTSGATAALKLVGEMFPISKKSHFEYLRANHNSVLGIRELFKQAGGSFGSISEENLEKSLWEREQSSFRAGDGVTKDGENVYHLFGYPAEDNYAGVKYPLEWIDRVKKHGIPAESWDGKRTVEDGKWLVLLDAAAYVPTNKLDLRKYHPDFVAVSWYKVFGFPNLGTLLVRNEHFDLCKKVFWGGGTVVISSCETDFCVLQGRPDLKYEDGTPAFLHILALPYGLRLMKELGIDRIQRHVWSLTSYLAREIADLKHSNGKKVAEIYGKHSLHDSSVQGGIVNFNLLTPSGDYVGYYDVQVKSAEVGFNLRTGVVCNPGACFDYLKISNSEVAEYYATKETCSDDQDVVNGKPLGSVRASLGYMSRFEDVFKLVQFLKDNYVH